MIKTQISFSAADLFYSIVPFVVSLQVKDILKPEVMEEVVMLTQQKLLEQEG